MNETSKPEAQAIIEALEQHLPKPQTITVKRGDLDQAELVLVPNSNGGFEFLNPKAQLDAYREFPKRREGVARLTTLASFIAHVNRSKDSQSAIFLDDTNSGNARPMFVAVFDYHLSPRVDEVAEPNAELLTESDPVSLARNLKHRATYEFPLSPEWLAWSGIGAKWWEPGDFAAWLEERIVDVLEPGAVPEKTAQYAAGLGITLAGKARLTELAKGLAVNVDRKVVNRVDLSTGETEMVFEERHSDKDTKAKLNIPGGIAISIPVVRGGDLFTMLVRFRYRIREGRVAYNLSPHNLDRIAETVVSEAEVKVAKDTGLPVFRGQPEGGAR